MVDVGVFVVIGVGEVWVVISVGGVWDGFLVGGMVILLSFLNVYFEYC